MNPLIQKYPLDPNRGNRGNFICNEPFDLNPQYGKVNKCVTFNGGYFFADTVTIVDSGGYTLMPDIDYQATYMNTKAVELTGSLVCGMLVITNPNINGTVYISGHLLGGDYCFLSPIIKNNIDVLKGLSLASPTWDNIVNKPEDFFPSGHFMLWSQMYGFTPFTNAINELTDQITKQSVNKIEQLLRDEINHKNDLMRLIQLLNERLTFHTRPTINSHHTSTDDVDLNLVENYPVITTNEIRQLNNTIPVRYVDSLKHNEIIEYWLGVKLDHFHEMDTEQLDTYSGAELDNKLNLKLSKANTAAAAHTIANKSVNTIANELPKNYTATEFKSGLFLPNKIASNLPQPGSILTNQGKFQPFAELLDLNYPGNKNLIILGEYDSVNEALNYLALNYANGTSTLCIFTLVKYFEVDSGFENISYPVLVERVNGTWTLKGI